MKPSKRIKKLRTSIIQNIPYRPNDKDSLSVLDSSSLNDLLFHNLNWRSRIVPGRQRKWVTLPSVTGDHRWKNLKSNIENLRQKVNRADDLRPHLSLLVFERGYTPSAFTDDGRRNIWADKDQILNKTGLYHFHLGQKIEPHANMPSGLADRTDDVLFAFVNRTHFIALAIANHAAFEFPTIENQTMNIERSKLLGIYESYMSQGRNIGDAYLANQPMVASGHTLAVRRMADIHEGTIEQIEPRFDSNNWRSEIFGNSGENIESRDHIQWDFNYMDLGLHDRKSGIFYCIEKGPI